MRTSRLSVHPRPARRNPTASTARPLSPEFCCRSPNASIPGSWMSTSGAPLALRPPSPWETNPGGRLAQSDVLLAMMLARYDRAIARSLVEPLTRGNGPAAVYFSSRGELHAAAAAIDPSWAVALVEALPDDADLKIQSSKNSAADRGRHRAGPRGRAAVQETGTFLPPPLGAGH